MDHTFVDKNALRYRFNQITIVFITINPHDITKKTIYDHFESILRSIIKYFYDCDSI